MVSQNNGKMEDVEDYTVQVRMCVVMPTGMPTSVPQQLPELMSLLVTTVASFSDAASS